MATVETPELQTVRAQAKYVHATARKARLITDLIRGRSVPEARTILAFSTRAVAEDVEKVLRSAIANAESRPDLHWNGDDLYIVTAYADEGPTLKRHRERARGRVGRVSPRGAYSDAPLPHHGGARAEPRCDRRSRGSCSRGAQAHARAQED